MTWNRLFHAKLGFSFSRRLETCLPFGVKSDKLCFICISILSFENMLNLKYFMTSFTIDPWISLLELRSHRKNLHLCIHLCLQISSIYRPFMCCLASWFPQVWFNLHPVRQTQIIRHSPYSRKIKLISNQIKIHYIIFWKT